MADPSTIPSPEVCKIAISAICSIGALLVSLVSLALVLYDRHRNWRQREADDLQFIQFCHERKKVSGGYVVEPEAGSDRHLWAERMVERGKFVRRDQGNYEVRVEGYGSSGKGGFLGDGG